MRLRQLVTVMALGVLAGSCSLGDSTDSAVINLFIGVSDSQLATDEEMTITVTARNVGFDPITLTGPGNCLIYVDALDSQGQIVWNSNSGCTATVSEELVVGVDKVVTFTWAGQNQGGGRLPGGFYHLRAVARMADQAYFGPPVSVALE